jgi:hypothetical protein
VVIIPSEPALRSEPAPVSVPKTAEAKQAEPGTDEVSIPGEYVINLLSSTKKLDMGKYVKNETIRSNHLYQTTFIKDGITWYRLRLGFFTTRSAANDVLKKLGSGYREAWITKATKIEKGAVVKQMVGTDSTMSSDTAPDRSTYKKPSRKELPARTARRADMTKTMELARKAVIEKKYTLAVRLYTKVLQSADTRYHQDAQEFLGLARERNNQLAHAKAEYQIYLKKYPEGEGAKRVQQRLNALLTVRMKAKPRLRAAKKRAEESRTDVSGSFSQYYRYDASETDSATTTDQSYLITDLSLTTRTRKGDYDIRTQFNGNYQWEFISRNEDTFRVSNLYIDARDRGRNLSAKVGRQTRSTGGVLGRFDGGVFSYGIRPKVKLNLVAGYPVSSTENTTQTNKYFYGTSIDIGTFAEHWNVTGYAINQIVDDITDRTAIGSEIRYFDKDQSYFTLVDYDTSYKTLNTALFLANYRFPNNATLNLNADYRKSPFLTTTSALQGQGVFTIEELLATKTEDEIRALAEDRSATSTMVTVSGSYPLSSKYTVSADVTASHLSSTPASGGVAATPSTGKEFFYSAQLLVRELFKKGDISIVGLRYSDSSTANSTTFTVNSRYPVNAKIRANPRFIYIRQNRNTGTVTSTIRPSLRMDYRWDRKLNIELDAGMEWVDDSLTPANDRFSYFIYLGFRKDYY